eukprot:1137503-Pelagomonas_calceolata.AAC.7
MSAMQALSVKVTATQAEEMIRELDVTARGAIQLPQFIILMERHTHVRIVGITCTMCVSKEECIGDEQCWMHFQL